MRLIDAAIVVFFCLPSSAAFSADSTVWHHRVAVYVSCKDEALRSQITSFLSRELRGLGDVDITDEKPTFKISVVAISVTLKSGYEVGYAFSAIITSPLGARGLELGSADKLKPEAKANIAQILEGHDSLEYQELLVGSYPDLRQSLTEIIAKFDANNLDPRRKMRHQLKDAKS